MAARDRPDHSDQDQTWAALYARLRAILADFGTENAFARGDFFVLDEDCGPRQMRVEINNLALLRPPVIKALQATLRGHPDWKSVVAVDVRGTEGRWPHMGLVLRAGDIVDGLQRDYLPAEFRNIRYEGSRPGTAYD